MSPGSGLELDSCDTIHMQISYLRIQQGYWSTTAYIFMIDGTLIAWKGRKQPVTARSSTEVGHMAVSEATDQAIWIRHFLYAISKGSVYNYTLTTIYEDNQEAIQIADKLVNHAKANHTAVRYHAIQSHIDSREVRLEHLAIDRMVVDGLMKTTNHATQERLVDSFCLA